jgi:hypothetical protein
MEGHFIDNEGDPEGAYFFIIKLFAGTCSGQVVGIQIDEFTDLERVKRWESKVISIVLVAVLSLHKYVMKEEDGRFDLVVKL